MAKLKYRTISKRTVDALSVEDRDAVFWDDRIPGFGVRVYPSGSKVYVVQTRHKGKSRRVTLGRHGVITADKARKEAALAINRIKSGEEPVERGSVTVAELAARYLEEHVDVRCKESTQRMYRSVVERFIVPAYGGVAVEDVERKHINALHLDLRHIPYQANRALGVLSKMFALAEVWGWRPDGSNPCRHVKRYKENKRERFLSPEETERLGEVLREAELEMPSAVAAFRLLLLTGCRLSEIQFLRWEYGRDYCIELPDAKTGGWVGPEARAVLANLTREENNPWVIRGRLPVSLITDLQRPWRRIRARRAGGRANSRPSSFVCFESAGPGREPHHDREATRSHAGADYRALRAPRAGLDPVCRGTGHREHRRESHPQTWLMMVSHVAPRPCPGRPHDGRS